MPQGQPLDAEQRERIIDLARSGEPRNAVARTVGVSTATVTRVTRAAGVSFTRERTRVATEARSTDLRARRGELEAALLDDAARIRAQLWKSPQPNPHEMLALAKATGVLIDRSVKLSLVDSDHGVGEARSMLGQLSEELHFVVTHHDQWTEHDA